MKRLFVLVATVAMICVYYHVCHCIEYRPKVNGGNSQSISLSGRLPSDIEIVEVTWSNNKGGSGIASGTTNWTISDIALTCCDDNIITVYAKDSEGTIIHTSYITVDVATSVTTSIAPSNNFIVSINHPTSDDYYNPPGPPDPQTISLSGTVSGSSEIVEVTWSNNKRDSGIASGTTNWTISDITLYCGDYDIITVYAKDSEGNIGTDILTVDVAPCPPTGLIFDLDYFSQYEKEAREANRGLWADDAPKKERKLIKEEYIGSKQLKIYHWRTCTIAQKIAPADSNIFYSVQKAVDAGYLPCKSCRPPYYNR